MPPKSVDVLRVVPLPFEAIQAYSREVVSTRIADCTTILPLSCSPSNHEKSVRGPNAIIFRMDNAGSGA